jgi:hypothetical protein
MRIAPDRDRDRWLPTTAAVDATAATASFLASLAAAAGEAEAAHRLVLDLVILEIARSRSAPAERGHGDDHVHAPHPRA